MSSSETKIVIILGCLNQVKDEKYNELIIEQISRRLK